MRQREEGRGRWRGGQKEREGFFWGVPPFYFPFPPPPYLKPVPGSQNWSVSVFLPVCLSFPLFLFFSPLLPSPPPCLSSVHLSSPHFPQALAPLPKPSSESAPTDPGPRPIVSRLFHDNYASGSSGKRKTGGGSPGFPTLLRHQLLRSGSRKIDACAKRDNNPRSMCPNPCSQGGGQPKKCRPEQARAAPGILGFIPVGLGCGKYF